MDLLERVKKYQEFGISYNTIAKRANIGTATMKRFVGGTGVTDTVKQKINDALHDIAIEVYAIGFDDENKVVEEWED